MDIDTVETNVVQQKELENDLTRTTKTTDDVGGNDDGDQHAEGM